MKSLGCCGKEIYNPLVEFCCYKTVFSKSDFDIGHDQAVNCDITIDVTIEEEDEKEDEAADPGDGWN